MVSVDFEKLEQEILAHLFIEFLKIPRKLPVIFVGGIFVMGVHSVLETQAWQRPMEGPNVFIVT